MWQQLWEEDKRHHTAYSFALLLVFEQTGIGVLAAALLTLGIGLGKEIYDHFYGRGYCHRDMIANLLGTSSACLCALLLQGLR